MYIFKTTLDGWTLSPLGVNLIFRLQLARFPSTSQFHCCENVSRHTHTHTLNHIAQ